MGFDGSCGGYGLAEGFALLVCIIYFITHR
nr:sporulation protein YjcZ [Bacillus cereus]